MNNKKILFFCAIITMSVFGMTNDSHAREYWIDPVHGNDANVGSQVLPRKNLGSSVLRLALRPGDTVYLMDGIYEGSQGFYSASNNGVDGTKESPITITAAPGTTPIFKGCGQYGVYLTLGRQWYIVDGLTFDVPENKADCVQAVTFAILFQGNNNIVRNNKFLRNGIRLDKSDFNVVENNIATNIGNAGGGLGEGAFVVVRGGEYNIIQNNIVNGAGHSGIDLLDYPNLVRLSRYNIVRNNTIDQGIGPGLNGGGGGIYLGVQSGYNLIEGNVIRNVGQMVGLTQNKAGIIIIGPQNIIRNNRVESYGKEGVESHRGIYLFSQIGFNDLYTVDNIIEGNYIGPGYGIPLYVREGTGHRVDGVTVANNTFRNNTITTQISALASGNFIGNYTPAAKYPIYIGSYQDGAWPTFANGNKFINTKFLKPDGSNEDRESTAVRIAYYYGSGGFGKTIAQIYTEYPAVFFDSLDVIPPVIPSNMSVQ